MPSEELTSSQEDGCYLSPDPTADDGGGLQVHTIAWAASGAAAFIACALSFVLIYKHLTNYTNKKEQKLVVRILLMVPIYAIDSFLSFRFVWLAVFFDLGRDCYEAFVIYTFFSLLLEYIGGYESGKIIFEKKPAFTFVIPLCCFRFKPKRGFLRVCKQLTLQYVIIRPLMSLCAVVMQAKHVYCPGTMSFDHGYLYVTIVLFFSVSIAMYALVLFYSVAKNELAPNRPIPKFLSIKFVIFLSFWQSVIVSGLVDIKVIKRTTFWSTADVAEGVQDALLCAEMLIASIIHFYVFDADKYLTHAKTPFWKSLVNAFNVIDIVEDVHHSFSRKVTQSFNYKNAVSREDTLPISDI